MTANTIQPVQSSQRTAIIDMLRGWALLGVVLMNYIDYYYMGLDFKNFHPGLFTGILQGVGGVLFSQKSWTMLSFLFGYGFSVLMQNVEAKGVNPVVFFSRRMFWLFILALLNSAFFWGDILKDYAVMGMVILLFRKSSAKTSFIISLVLFIAVPAVAAYVNSLKIEGGMSLLQPYLHLFESRNPLKVLWFGLVGTWYYEIMSPNYLVTCHVVMLCCFFFGMAAQKSGFFTHLADNKKHVKRVFWFSLASVLIVGALIAISQNLKWTWTNYYRPFYWIILGSMLFFVSALSWLYINEKLKAFFSSMQAIGKMTLTNYITQNIIALFLFSGIGLSLSLKHRLDYGYYFLFAFIIYVAQVYFSKWWLTKYQYGPIEWVWRQLSYAKRLPIKKPDSSFDEAFSAAAVTTV